MRFLRWISNNEKRLLIGICLAAALLLGLDIIDDLSHGSNFEHIASEALIVLLATVGVIVLALRGLASKKENIRIREDLLSARNDLKKYKIDTQHLIQGLNQKIDAQLMEWNLTAAEKEIALLLLRGFSVKEIASIRDTSEKTTAQQISSIYDKSGLHGRAELSAYFLEDMLTPVQASASAPKS